MKQSTFNLFTLKTISNDYLHCLLIIFEYLFFIFPSLAKATMKINCNQGKEDYASKTTQINTILIFKYLHFSESSLLSIIICGVIFVLLIFYVVLYYLVTFENKAFNCFEYFIANVYDLVIFRYFSIIPLNISLMLFFKQTAIGSISNIVLSFVYLIFFIAFSLINYSFITHFAVYMNISNPQLVDIKKKYPFDQLSKEYDMLLLILKVFISFEYNYYNYSDKISLVIVSLNVMMLLISFILFIWLYILNTFVYRHISFLYANTKQNALRKGISVFNFILICFGLIFFKETITTLNIVISAVISLNITLITLYFEDNLSKLYHSTNQIITCDEILFMLIVDHRDQDVLLQIKLMQESFMQTHKKKCYAIENGYLDTCYLCNNMSDSNDKIISNIYVLSNYLKYKKNINTFNGEMVKLFYYKINAKPFKYFRYYYYLIHKYKNTKVNYAMNMSLISNKWLKNKNEMNNEFIDYLLKTNSIEHKIIKLLDKMHDFITENIELKKPETIIGLSSDLSNSTITIRTLYQKNGPLSQLDPILKIINGFISFHINILRFIIENLINQPLSSLFPLKIENLEDFINLHFSSDQIIICSIDLSLIFNQEIYLLSTTRAFTNYETKFRLLSDYFPKEIHKEGLKLFNHQINTSVSSNTKSESKIFKFPFLKKGFIEYIKYTFLISPLPKTSKIVIYGQYARLKTKCLLLDLNHPQIKILALCKEFFSLLKLEKKMMILFKEINLIFYMKNIFQKINKKNDKIIESEFNMKHFINHFYSLFKELQTLTSFKSDANYEILFKATVDKMNKYQGESIQIIFEKITEYSKGICLFNMKMQSTYKKVSMIRNNNTDDPISEEIEEEQQDNNFVYNIHSTTYSASSVSIEQSLSSHTQSKNYHNSEYTVINSELHHQIEKEAKKLSLFTLLMLGLNIVLIIICIVFLFTQIDSTTQLSELSQLYFHFKNIRWVVVNFFLSLVTTICYSSTPYETQNCLNGYGEYNIFFHNQYGLPPEYDLLKYAVTELQSTTQFALNSLDKFKRLIYSSSNIHFQKLLETQMKYYEFTLEDDINVLIIIETTFEEGLKKYINSIIVLTETNYDEGYVDTPIYFISYNDGTYLFEESIVKNLNPTQKEIYKGITNYLNFLYSFSIGDSQIKNQFDQLCVLNNGINIIFMCVIALLNFILFVLCKKNIATAYYIFKVLIYNLILQTEEQDNMSRLKSKIENLILLSKFYKKNPNKIIKILSKEKSFQAHRKANPQFQNVALIENGSSAKAKAINISFGSSFYHFIQGKFIKILYITFGVFFIIIIVFDLVLVFQYQAVLNIFDYVLLSYNTDHSIMTNLAITTLSYIGNISNSDLVFLMGVETSNGDLLNSLIIESFEFYPKLYQFTSLNSSRYPTVEQYANYSCEGLFYSINDSFNGSSSLQIDYRIANMYICQEFQLFHVPHFNYLRGLLPTQTMEIVNNQSQRDYASIYAFTFDQNLYTLYLITLMIFRPISQYLKDNILVPKITTSFEFYVALVGVYLAVNIVLEIILFIAVKWGINKPLCKIQKNLYLLNNCVN